jgi:hypothetical protein
MAEVKAMDSRRFDAWTRALAEGHRRRDAIRMVAGMSVAGLVSRAPAAADTTCEHFEGVCSKRDECCTSEGLACINTLCLTCVAEDGKCQPDAPWGSECCNGFKCDSRELKCIKNPDVQCEAHGCKKKKGKGKGKGKKNGHKHGNSGGQDGFCDNCPYLTKCNFITGACDPVECVLDSDCPGGCCCADDFTCY